MKSEIRKWILALLLALPFQLPWILHYTGPHAEGLLPTGFIQYDQPYYFANAREHFDPPGFSLLYSNAAAPHYAGRHIYFQPQTFALGCIWKLTGMEPGILLCVFGLVFGLIAMRLIIALTTRILSAANASWIACSILFAWGGGLFWLWGVAQGFRSGFSWDLLFRHDPAEGWWMLNFGRNLVYPMEAYYHAVFLGLLLAGLLKKRKTVLGLAALLSLSHPFSGTVAVCFVFGWFLLDRVLGKPRALPLWFGAAGLGLIIAHLAFYAGWLGSDPAHKALVTSWRINWPVPGMTLLLGNAIVAVLALWTCLRIKTFRAFWQAPQNRMFIALAITVFLLGQHNRVIDPPYQPIHFDHGYLWTALFLCGLPALSALWNRFTPRRAGWAGFAFLLPFTTAFCADNAIWLYRKGIPMGRGYLLMTTQDKEWLAELNRIPQASVIIPPNDYTGYLVTVYTPHRSWIGHTHLTPDVSDRERELHLWWQEGRLEIPEVKSPIIAVSPESFRERIQQQSHRIGAQSVRLSEIWSGGGVILWGASNEPVSPKL